MLPPDRMVIRLKRLNVKGVGEWTVAQIVMPLSTRRFTTSITFIHAIFSWCLVCIPKIVITQKAKSAICQCLCGIHYLVMCRHFSYIAEHGYDWCDLWRRWPFKQVVISPNLPCLQWKSPGHLLVHRERELGAWWPVQCQYSLFCIDLLNEEQGSFKAVHRLLIKLPMGWIVVGRCHGRWHWQDEAQWALLNE